MRGSSTILIALILAGCASRYAPPTESTLDALDKLKAAQLSDEFLAPDFAAALQRDLGAKRVEASGSAAYSRVVLGQIRGMERRGPVGAADIIVERWEEAAGPVTQVTFRPKVAVPGPRVAGLFRDYVSYDDGRQVIVDHFGVPPAGWYEAPSDFSLGFYCSKPGIERKLLVGVDSFFGRPLEYRFISRRFPGFDGSVPQLTGKVLVEPADGWRLAIHTPPASYPDRARALEKQGRVRLGCLADNNGKLSQCEAQSEDPQGLGFAAAALAWSTNAALQAPEGPRAMTGQSSVHIDLVFGLRNLDQRCSAA